MNNSFLFRKLLKRLALCMHDMAQSQNFPRVWGRNGPAFRCLLCDIGQFKNPLCTLALKLKKKKRGNIIQENRYIKRLFKFTHFIYFTNIRNLLFFFLNYVLNVI